MAKTVGFELWVKEHQLVTKQLKRLLAQAQDMMRKFAYPKRRERQFQVGEYVYLKLKPYKQMSLRKSKVWKLTPRYCGPFMVSKRVGEVAYELQQPAGAKIHPVPHVSQLKKHIGPTNRVVAELPQMDPQGQFILVPVKVLDKRIMKRNNAAAGQWLVQWAHAPEEEATWEFAEEMMQKFPTLKP